MSVTLPGALVSTTWLADHLGEPDLVVVDASWYLAAMQRDPRAEYLAAHIPGAVFYDLDAESDRGTSLPHMLPDPATLARGLGGLGIGDTDRVVVYDGSGINLSAPRLWWTLKAAGHDAVAVLDGGFRRWREENRPVEAGPSRGATRQFTARMRPGLIRSLQQVRSALGTPQVQFLDARSRGRFEGTEPEPRPGLRGGHIPGARNLPFTELVGPDGRALPPEVLRARFLGSGVDLSRPVVVSCGSGVTACALALGLDLLGVKEYAVYDGSWSEWGREDGPPIETGPSS